MDPFALSNLQNAYPNHAGAQQGGAYQSSIDPPPVAILMGALSQARALRQRVEASIEQAAAIRERNFGAWPKEGASPIQQPRSVPNGTVDELQDAFQEVNASLTRLGEHLDVLSRL